VEAQLDSAAADCHVRALVLTVVFGYWGLFYKFRGSHSLMAAMWTVAS
jgi:hypothetical protein